MKMASLFFLVKRGAGGLELIGVVFYSKKGQGEEEGKVFLWNSTVEQKRGGMPQGSFHRSVKVIKLKPDKHRIDTKKNFCKYFI